MKKNNNGFTIIELLVVIAIMLSILGIVIFSVNKVSEAKKEEAYVEIKKQIMTAGKQYFETNEYLFEGLEEKSTGIVPLEVLVKEDYINNVVDPRTGNKLNKCSEVVVTKNNGKYTTKYKENNSEKCDISKHNVVVKEPGSASLKPHFYELLDSNHTEVVKQNNWLNVNSLGERKTAGVKLNVSENGNGPIVSVLAGDVKLAKTDNDYYDIKNFAKQTEGILFIPYTVINSSGRTVRAVMSAGVDTIKPTCKINSRGKAKIDSNNNFVSEYNVTNFPGWYTSNVNFNVFDESDDIIAWSYKSDSGWKSKEFNNKIFNNIKIESDGKARFIIIHLNDKAGNINDIKSDFVKIDKTSPVIEIINNSKEVWVNSPVKLDYSAVENGSGIRNWEYNSNGTWFKYGNSATKNYSITYTDERNNEVYARAVDNAGNYSIEKATWIKIDRTPPKCSTYISSGSNKNGIDYKNAGWYTSNVNLTGNCKDGGSGCKKSSITKTINYETKKQNFSVGTVYDNAGNSVSCPSVNFGIDRTSPKCNITVGGTKGNKVGNKQWYIRNNVNLSINTNAGNNESPIKYYGLDTIKGSNNKAKIKTQTNETSNAVWYSHVQDEAGNTCNSSTSFGLEKTVKLVFDAGTTNNTISVNPGKKSNNNYVFNKNKGACGYGNCSNIKCMDGNSQCAKGYFARSCMYVKTYKRSFKATSMSTGTNVSVSVIDGENDAPINKTGVRRSVDNKRFNCSFKNTYYTNCGNSSGGLNNFSSHSYNYTSPAGLTSNSIKLYTEYTINCGY